MRQCFIHIGTHKTGTKSLQHTLDAQQRRLFELGFLYPLSGRPAIAAQGHHNIAWEISLDDRFQAAYGCIDDLCEELRRFDRNVVLSSEDFSCGAYHCEDFSAFVHRLRRSGLDVKLVVYFRNQIDYAKSLYLALLIWGLEAPFTEFLDKIVERGRFHWRDWIFCFDYDEFLSRLQTVEGVEVIARSYDSLQNGALITDFVSILGLSIDDLAVQNDLRLNARRPPLTAAQHFYRNSVRRKLRQAEHDAIASLVPGSDRHADMSVPVKLRLSEAFEASNRRLFQRAGIAEFEAMRRDRILSDGDAELQMEEIFSPRLIEALRGSLKPSNKRAAPG
jgi:hypothetical protein